MTENAHTLSHDERRRRLQPFCEKHRIHRLKVFGSATPGDGRPDSSVDLLVTLDESASVSTDELVEMAGEVEELIGRPVDVVLRNALEKSPNRFAHEHFLATAVRVYGN